LQIYWNVLYFGVIGAGAIFTGVNPGYSVQELVDHFQLVRPTAMIVEPAMLEKTLAAARQYGALPTSKIFVFDVHEPFAHPEVLAWSNLLQHGESEFAPCPDPDTTVAAYQTTSGTSGL
jgi:acyl-CoA synthetase (AMP-forming)/AMP-acid ligase II